MYMPLHIIMTEILSTVTFSNKQTNNDSIITEASTYYEWINLLPSISDINICYKECRYFFFTNTDRAIHVTRFAFSNYEILLLWDADLAIYECILTCFPKQLSACTVLYKIWLIKNGVHVSFATPPPLYRSIKLNVNPPLTFPKCHTKCKRLL